MINTGKLIVRMPYPIQVIQRMVSFPARPRIRIDGRFMPVPYRYDLQFVSFIRLSTHIDVVRRTVPFTGGKIDPFIIQDLNIALLRQRVVRVLGSSTEAPAVTVHPLRTVIEQIVQHHCSEVAVTIINLPATRIHMLKDRDTYRVLVGRMDGTIEGAYSPAEDDIETQDHTMYLVTDGEEAGMYGTIEGAGDAVRQFFEGSDAETPLLVTPETHDLAMMDGDAADTLDYQLEDIPDTEYEELLENAK